MSMITRLCEADFRLGEIYQEALGGGFVKPLKEMNPGVSSGKSGNYDIMRMEGPGYVGYRLVARTGFGQESFFIQVMGTGGGKTVGISIPKKLLSKLPSTTRSGYVAMPGVQAGTSAQTAGQMFMGIYSNQHPIMTMDALDKDLQAMGATKLRQIETMSAEKPKARGDFEGEAPSPYAHEPETPGRGPWGGAYGKSGTGEYGAMGVKRGPGGFGMA